MHILHTHTKVRNFMCSQCPKRFPSTTALNIHINVHHSEVNPYKCTVCEKTFNHPSALMRHRKLHTGICEFVCEHCNKRFVRSDHLKKHIGGERVKSSETMEQSITKCCFNANGQIFAYAVGYDWSKGHEYYNPSKKTYIYLRPCFDELKPRPPS